MISLIDNTNDEYLYDEDSPSRVEILRRLRPILLALKKENNNCLGVYKAGLSMDFCKLCYDLGMLNLLVIPYESNDKKWPSPYRDAVKAIKTNAKSVVNLNSGGFNLKKLKKLDKFLVNTSSVIIHIARIDQVFPFQISVEQI